MIQIRDKDSQVIVCSLPNASTEGINLRGRRIRYANMSGANLRCADFHGCDLWGTDFRGADLRLADLSLSNVGTTDFRGANLAGADLKGARYNHRTQWPEGFAPQDWGAVLEDGSGPAAQTGMPGLEATLLAWKHRKRDE